MLEIPSVRLLWLWLSSLVSAVLIESGDCELVLVVELPVSLAPSDPFVVPENSSNDPIEDEESPDIPDEDDDPLDEPGLLETSLLLSGSDEI